MNTVPKYRRYKNVIITATLEDSGMYSYKLQTFASINKAKLYNRKVLGVAKVLEEKFKLSKDSAVTQEDMTKWAME